MATVMPLYDGHGCHRQVLTQYSVHNRAAPDAEFGHSAFLADATRVEERQLALALIDILGQEGSIVVYSSFEKTRISALCDAYPDLKQPLSALLARLVDLHAIVINNVYHPKFKGSFSLKSVLPALVPDLSYRGLAVADGDTAITRFARMARGEIAGDGVATTRDQLLEYCRRDTLAMVRLHEVLAQMGQWTSGHAAPVVEREFL
jgi:predicted RecB family nuclease